MFAPKRLTTEREALAAAIASHRERVADTAATTAALDRATTAQRAAWEAVEAAQRAVEAVPEALAAYALATARGTAGDAPPSLAPPSLATARLALDEAQAQHAAQKAAVTALKGELDRAGSTEGAAFVAKNVRTAAAAVLGTSPAVATLVAEVQRLQSALLGKGAAMLWLLREGALPGAEASREAPTSPVREAVLRLQTPSAYWTPLPGEAAPTGPATWQAALNALMADASAPFPKG